MKLQLTEAEESMLKWLGAQSNVRMAFFLRAGHLRMILVEPERQKQYVYGRARYSRIKDIFGTNPSDILREAIEMYG